LLDGFAVNVLPQNFVPALLILVGGGLFSLLLARILERLARPMARRTHASQDHFVVQMIAETIPPTGWVLSASMAWRILPTSSEGDWLAYSLAKLILVVLLVRLANRISLKLLQHWAAHSEEEAVATMLRSLAPLVRAFLWCVGAVFYLQNVGVQMAAIWALLSAGGIGAGLALKEPVSEFFEYITILLDKPFQNGQLINVGEVWATVERVGVRSTRLRSLNGEAIVLSNSALTGSVVANYAELENRRLIYRLGVSYRTGHQTLVRIPGLLQSIVEQGDDAHFDRCHFVAFNDCSLDFELVYFVPTNDFKRAMDVQQRINLQIVECFAQERIDFASPTRTVQLLSEHHD
jgi:small-conductance mechanosensitive channel